MCIRDRSIGVYASGNSIVNINGNLTMKKDDGWAVNGDGFTFYGVSGLYLSLIHILMNWLRNIRIEMAALPVFTG